MKHSFSKINSKLRIKGFTLVELMISVGIFALMTMLLLTKYGNFNQSIFLTNLAYDIALTLRNAQSYGLNVKSAPEGPNNFSSKFLYPYGVHFSSANSGNPPANTIFYFFADSSYVVSPISTEISGDGIFTNGLDQIISQTTITRGSYVSAVCAGTSESDCDSTITMLDITFRRPDPNAIIYAGDGSSYGQFSYAKITLRASDGSTKNVEVRSTGQIAVIN